MCDTVESIHGKKLNKGEWAEFYVMLKLLGEGKIYAADELLRKNYKSYLDILKVIRQETSRVLDYVIDTKKGIVAVTDQETGKVLEEVSQKEFRKQSDILFDGMSKVSGKSIEAPVSVCDFARVIYVTKPKAPAVKALKKQFGGKNDIFIQVRDPGTSLVSVMGFSIKSKHSQNPTLFNAGSSSQFLFCVNGCDDEKADRFNAIEDKGNRGWSKCKDYLKETGMTLEFIDTKNPVYHDNLVLIRESMPDILGWCVKDRLVDADGHYEVMETVERLAKANPLGVSSPDVFYEKVMKDFLMAGFTGMTAGKVWDGKEQVNGGYIVVMADGDVLCFHSVDRERFRDYRYRNTHFEYVSTGKYVWGYIEKTEDGYVLPLNMSVRFNTRTR